MSDARWFEIEEDVAAAVEHFRNAATLHQRGGFEGDDLASYQARMAFMHAMQAGHTSMESAFIRILRIVGEDLPQGGDWHADLIRRVSHALPGRPAIIGPDLAVAADETRRFRHVAMKSYDRRTAPLWPRRLLPAAFPLRSPGFVR